VKLTLANQIDTPNVNGWVITAQDITEQAQLTAELRHQSLHDTLTGLPNRALLFDRIQHSVDLRTRNEEVGMSLVLVDIDDFKSFNDSLGHTTGDELLRAVADRLSACVRYGDTVARLGGDEFVILLEATDEAEALVLAERALESLALPVHIPSGSFAVRASAGVVCSRDAATPVELLRSADIAMYASKRDGKSKVTLFDPEMHDDANRQFELRMDLAVALARGEFWVAYQPIMDTRVNRISGAEALLRWKHPVLGEISPAEFIPVAEQSGQIRAIGQWVLRTACTEAAAWTGGGAESYVSVNVSAVQLNDQFADFVLATLAETRLPAHRLMLEITESMLVNESVNARSILSRLREVGVRSAIDDFGTGFSSLAYLQSLSVDVVKIDRAFVRDVDVNTDHQALTRTILSLADGFEMTAIAEGVETDRELAELTRLGCHYAQGFLFHRPVAAENLRELFERVISRSSS
jgi:diguanylate cyclase (GGDEF)-like protein